MGSYHGYCVRQPQYTSTRTVDPSAVRKWAKFSEATERSLLEFHLPLSDTSAPCEIMGMQLMDEQQTVAFESSCLLAHAQFCSSMFTTSAVVKQKPHRNQNVLHDNPNRYSPQFSLTA